MSRIRVAFPLLLFVVSVSALGKSKCNLHLTCGGCLNAEEEGTVGLLTPYAGCYWEPDGSLPRCHAMQYGRPPEKQFIKQGKTKTDQQWAVSSTCCKRFPRMGDVINCIADKACSRAFFGFVFSERSEENYNFVKIILLRWGAIFGGAATRNKRRSTLQHLCQKFIHTGSEFEINIGQDLKWDICNELWDIVEGKNGKNLKACKTSNAWDDTQPLMEILTHVAKTMQLDTWTRFKQKHAEEAKKLQDSFLTCEPVRNEFLEQSEGEEGTETETTEAILEQLSGLENLLQTREKQEAGLDNAMLEQFLKTGDLSKLSEDLDLKGEQGDDDDDDSGPTLGVEFETFNNQVWLRDILGENGEEEEDDKTEETVDFPLVAFRQNDDGSLEKIEEPKQFEEEFESSHKHHKRNFIERKRKHLRPKN